MVTVNELYGIIDKVVPKELSCEWDNDGRMVVPCTEKTVEKILICLDVTEEAVDYAIEKGFDCIISHHPLIFSPLKAVDADNHICRKVCKLIKNDIAVFSFHTRLDSVGGGVNDALADEIGLREVTKFSDVGRIAHCPPEELCGFVARVKERLSSDRPLVYVDGGKKVSRVAIVGGSGKGYLEEAVENGCDTFITGEMPFNCEHDAKELGINLICAGHYYTENLVCKRIKLLVENKVHGIVTEIYATNPAFFK